MRITRETDKVGAENSYLSFTHRLWSSKMNLFKRIVVLLGLVLAFTVPVTVPVLAQTVTYDGTTLKQIIIFGRHSIRSSTTCPSQLATYAVQAFPAFEVLPGCLTPNGQTAETYLGAYFSQYLTYEGLLTGNDQTDALHSYFRSNSIERSWLTALSFANGLIPSNPPPVNSYPIGQTDPVFDPIAAGVAQVDPNLAATQVQQMFNSGTALSSAWSGEFSLILSTLQPPSLMPSNCPSSSSTPCVDPTAQPITLTANPPQSSAPYYYTGGIINEGGLETTLDAADPFVMQYADGLETAWGELSLDQVSQQTRLVGLHFNIEMRSPYLARVQSSNAASHILRTMQQAVNGVNLRGAFGNAKSRTVVVISSDAYVAGLAGLLNLHWQLPEYQPDFCAPGGALVFELRESSGPKQYFVRVFYTAQTLDQLRNLSTLSLGQPPATMQLLVPGGSNSATDFDVNFGVFQKLMMNAIGQQYVENPRKEVPPEPLAGVTCQPEPGCPE